VCHATLRLIPWRSRLLHDLAAKSCPAHHFIIWNRILQLFLTNYFSVSNTSSGSITRFDQLLFSIRLQYRRTANTPHTYSYFLSADNVCVAQNNHSLEKPRNLTEPAYQSAIYALTRLHVSYFGHDYHKWSYFLCFNNLLCPRYSKNGGGALSVTLSVRASVRACVRPS